MTTRPFQRTFAIAAAVIAGIALTLGFIVVGSPFTVRLRKLDDRRVEDLRAIHAAIQRMVIERPTDKPKLKRPLPSTLDEVAAHVRSEQYQSELSLHDPQTGAVYVYRVTGETQYELEATFTLSRSRKQDMFWNHPAGTHVYQFDAMDAATQQLADHRGP